VRRKASREKFVAELVAFLRLHRLDGVDYNWEYPGYQFGRGYLADEEVKCTHLESTGCNHNSLF